LNRNTEATPTEEAFDALWRLAAETYGEAFAGVTTAEGEYRVWVVGGDEGESHLSSHVVTMAHAVFSCEDLRNAKADVLRFLRDEPDAIGVGVSRLAINYELNGLEIDFVPGSPAASKGFVITLQHFLSTQGYGDFPLRATAVSDVRFGVG
jgi:hypothetical protein